MLNPLQARYVIQATQAAKRPDLTLRVWNLALTYIRQDTGEITATREQLASDARTSVSEVSRAMCELTRIGAIIRQKEGRHTVYFVNPFVGWNGGEGTRREAAQKAPKLQAV